MDTIELIEDYLKGRLKGQELENFEVRMASDPAFAQEVEDHRAMQEMIFTQGLLETREKLQAIRKVRQEQGGNKGGWSKGLGILVLSLLVMTSIYVLFIKDKSPDHHKQERTILKEENKEGPSIYPGNESKNIASTNKKQEETGIRKAVSQKVDSSSNVKDQPMVVVNPDSQALNPVKPIPGLMNPNLPNPSNPHKVKLDLCSGVSIKAKILKEASCLDKATGKLHMTQLTGGTRPYSFSINDSPSGEQTSFTDLNPGHYLIKITDANGCFVNLEAEVDSKTCQPEKSNIFAPDFGETWKFPINSGGNCKVRIMNASGTVVYEVNTLNGQPSEWNGVGNNESYLKAAAYIYQISCEDGGVQQGSVTITR